VLIRPFENRIAGFGELLCVNCFWRLDEEGERCQG
jgi:hypothetical protein